MLRESWCVAVFAVIASAASAVAWSAHGVAFAVAMVVAGGAWLVVLRVAVVRIDERLNGPSEQRSSSQVAVQDAPPLFSVYPRSVSSRADVRRARPVARPVPLSRAEVSRGVAELEAWLGDQPPPS